MKSSNPDSELVKRFLKGDGEAFDMLMERYEKPLYFYVLRMAGNHEDAADICQNTFVQVFKKVRGFMARSQFKTWLYRIATNQTMNLFRSREVERTVPLRDDHNPSTEHTLRLSGTEGLDESGLRNCIDELPEKQRATLVLRVYQDLSFREIGRVLACSEGTAKVNYHYAVKALRKSMRHENGLQKS